MIMWLVDPLKLYLEIGMNIFLRSKDLNVNYLI